MVVVVVMIVCCVPKAIGRVDEVMQPEENASRSFLLVGLKMVHGPQAEAVTAPSSYYLHPVLLARCQIASPDIWGDGRAGPQSRM